MAYPTAAELVALSSVTALTSLSVQHQTDLFISSKSAVEEFCGQEFVAEAAVTRKVNGSGSNILYLDKRLETLTAFSSNDSDLELGDIALAPEKDRLIAVSEPASSWNYYTRTLRDMDDSLPLKFVFGEDNISLTGNWGWSVFPPAVALAIRKDMEDTALADANVLNHTLRSFRKLGLRDVSQGNLRATLVGAPGLSPEVMTLLDPYIWRGEVGAVV